MGRARTRRPFHLLPTLLAVIALATCGAPPPTPIPTASPAPGTPAASPTSAAAPRPSAGPTGWSPVVLGDMPEVATLEPITAGPAAVAADTSFRLRSLDGRSPLELAVHLRAEPDIDFAVVSTSGDTAVVKPATTLAPRTTYRISLVRADGSAEASWVAHAAGPLQITETTPGNASTKVPLTTGVEVRFDQYGVTSEDFSHHFSIRPAVAGRFVAAGQAVAFVPKSPLAKGRLYTVTVTRGLPLPGTGEVLEADYRFQFETAGTVASPIVSWFPRALIDSATADRPAFAVDFSVPDGGTAPRSLPVTVHQVADLAGAQDAWRAILAAPEWTRVASTEAVPTEGLTQVFKGTLPLKDIEGASTKWLELPNRLAAGWYVVTERWAGVPRQTLLQVTDLATFAMVSTDRTFVWVNDLRTKGVVVNASVTIDTSDFGSTDSRGLAVGRTPASVSGGHGDNTVVVVAGSQTGFYPLTSQRVCVACVEGPGYGGLQIGMPTPVADRDAWWRLAYTDRAVYRSTDTVNVWGMVRNRDAGTVPGTVTLALSAVDGGGTPISSAQASPDHAGAFAAQLPLRDVPVGQYAVRLTVEGEVIAETWFDVETIVKPAWRLSIETTPHAVIGEGTVSVQTTARFFDGTPVAGTSVTITEDEVTHAVSTDASGRASADFTVSAHRCDQQCGAYVSASATLPEDGWISTSAEVTTFRANGFVDVDSDLSGTRLSITGKVSDIALERFEVPGANQYDVNPRGAPVPRATVMLAVVEDWWVQVQVGTRYDFITKQVVPVYEGQFRSRTIPIPAAKTASDGTFRAQLTVHGGDRSYRVTAAYSDLQGRATSASTYASQPTEDATSSDPYLANVGSHPSLDQYTLGETVRVRFSGGVARPPVARYLYVVSQRGLRYVTVGTTPTFRTTFDRTAQPSIKISAVRFNGVGYETAVASYTATAAPAQNKITVEVTADRARYAPGDTATVTVRTLAPTGLPVPASVYLGVVDEKLYGMGLAWQPDVLGDLYQKVDDGVVAVVRSHLTPADDALGSRGWGQGDTTGGGGGDRARSEFRDWLLATLLTTDASGRATVQVPLSDDLTSWHVAASAVDASLRAGSATLLLPVGLPFFVEATLQSEYLVGERPVLRVRGFGPSLGAGDQVSFTVASDTLPMAQTTGTAKAFEAAEIALPTLPPGSHTIRITGRCGGQTDTLVRSFTVVASRAVTAATTWEPLSSATGIKAGSSGAFTRVLLVEAGRGRVIPALSELASLAGDRSDQLLAAGLAQRVLRDVFGIALATSTDAHAIDHFASEGGGLAITWWGSSNLEVTALAAMARDPRLAQSSLRGTLAGVAFDEHASRDRRFLALAGLAALGDPVLGEVRNAATATDLTTQEQASLALAALYAGDEALAGRLERSVLTGHGLVYGPWLRISTGEPQGDVVTTARLAIVAASLGDPVAGQMDAWLETHPATTTLTVLERALAASGWAHRVGGAKAVVRVTVDGAPRDVAIEPGEPVALALTSAQAAAARLEPVSGAVLLVTSREVPLAPGSLTKPDGVSISRSVSPPGSIGLTDRVVVTIRVTLAKAARADVWRVVDWTPSGLSAIGGDSWHTSDPATWIVGPVAIDGQRVDFSIGGNPKVGTWILRYIARVISPGVYRWEGTVIQSAIAPDRGIVLAPETISVGRAGGG